MQLKFLLKQPSFVFIMAGIIFSLLIIFFLSFDLLGQISYAKSASLKTKQDLVVDELAENIKDISFTEQSTIGFPISLSIPKINVDTTIESVGLTLKGAVDVPKNPANAAWFNLGPRPGDSGSAVITGHYGRWKNGQGSVFDDLYKLRQGDKLYVKDDKGITISFVVRESRRYNPSEKVSEVFVSSDGKAHLNLITCEGVWNQVSKSYSKRLVVFTDKE